MTNITTEMVRVVQNFINESYMLDLMVDGVLGKKTKQALLYVTTVPTHWKVERQVIGIIQSMCVIRNIPCGPIDGYWGPQTETAYEMLDWKSTKYWQNNIPKTQSRYPSESYNEMVEFFGNPGENQTRVKSPYPLRIAWNTDKVLNSFMCHEKVADDIEYVLSETLRLCKTLPRIQVLGLDLFGGCLNVRRKRGGTDWSMHAWGVAIDWDPANNKLKWNDTKARLANDVYDEWFDLWEDVGWTSLGKVKNYDWQHIQAPTL